MQILKCEFDILGNSFDQLLEKMKEDFKVNIIAQERPYQESNYFKQINEIFISGEDECLVTRILNIAFTKPYSYQMSREMDLEFCEKGFPQKIRAQSMVIKNRLGVHARPSAQLCSTSRLFDALILIEFNKLYADGKGMMDVAMLAMPFGSEISVISYGVDADDAIKAIKYLVEEEIFGEE